MSITELPDPPERTDPENFSTKADAFLGALPDFATETNALAVEVSGYKDDAVSSATSANLSSESAEATANFSGIWSTLTGALTFPASVYHSSQYWQLTESITDVTAEVPGTSDKWISSQSGDLFLKVNTIADLRAITYTPTDGQIVNVLGYYASTENRDWRFQWVDGDLSAEVTADTQSGLYVGVTAIPTTTGAFVRLWEGYTFVTWFGARGDGSNNNVTEITAAMLATPLGGTLFFPKGIYSLQSAETNNYLLTLTKNINLLGDGARGSVLRADSVSLTTSLLQIRITENGGATDVRNWFMKNLNVGFNVGGLNGVEFTDGLRIFTSELSNCLIGSGSATGAKSLYVSDPSAIKHSTVELNTFEGEVHLAVGDAFTFRKNLVFGTSTGVRVDVALGVYNTTIENNTIVVSGNAVWVRNGDTVRIINNQMEQSGLNVGVVSSMIYIEGQDRVAYNTVIENNNIGGGTNVDYNIYLNNCKRAVITKNQMTASGDSDIYCSASTAYNIFEFDNRVNGTTSDPRPNELFVAEFTNLSSTNIQMPITVSGLNSWTIPADSVYRDKTGVVHFTQPISGGTTTLGTQVFATTGGLATGQANTFAWPCMDKGGVTGFVNVGGSISGFATIGSVATADGFFLQSYQGIADQTQ